MGVQTVWRERTDTARAEEGSEDSAFGVWGVVSQVDVRLARAHISGIHHPDRIHFILDLSSLSLDSGINIIFCELRNGSCLSVSSGAFIPAHLRHPSSGSLGFPERIATSESSSGPPELRTHLCSVPSLVLVSKYPVCLVHERQGGILISISALTSPCKHT